MFDHELREVERRLARLEARQQLDENKLDRILWVQQFTLQKVTQMSAEMDTLTTAVGRNTTVVESALVLIQGFKAQLDAAIANGNDPVALKALSDSLGTEDDKLAAAVAANTPAAPPAA